MCPLMDYLKWLYLTLNTDQLIFKVIEAELSQKDEPEEKTEPVGSDSSSSSSSSASTTDGEQVEQEIPNPEESKDDADFEDDESESLPTGSVFSSGSSF